MHERRLLWLVAATLVFLISAAVWKTFVRPAAPADGGAAAAATTVESIAVAPGPRDTARAPVSLAPAPGATPI